MVTKHSANKTIMSKVKWHMLLIWGAKFCNPSNALSNLSSHKKTRLFLWGLALPLFLLLLSGCNDPLQNAINAINNAMSQITAQSTAWRDALTNPNTGLVAQLGGLESQATGDVKGVLTDATNQISDLETQAANLTDQTAGDIIHKAGAQVFCTGDFVRQGALALLQSVKDDLTFWKNNHKQSNQKPNHAICSIDPGRLALYPKPGGGYGINNTPPPGEVDQLWGYNFFSDALPTLDLLDANKNVVRRNILKSITYSTHYLIYLDFSTYDFSDVKGDGYSLQFNWPDTPEQNGIPLTVVKPARLQISDPSTWIFTPGNPTAMQDCVNLQVSITNIGDLQSGSFTVYWKPDPSYLDLKSVIRNPIDPKISTSVNFPCYTYKRSGSIQSAVYLGNGDDSKSRTLGVASPPATINALSIVIGSGDDGLRNDSEAEAWLTLTNGTTWKSDKLNNGNPWKSDDNTWVLSPSMTWKLPGQIQRCQMKQFTIYGLMGQGGVFQTGDNWNLQSIRVTYTDSNGSPGTLVSTGNQTPGASYLQRFTSSVQTWNYAVASPRCP